MLEALARFDIRFRWLIVAVWVVGAVAASRALPSLGSVAQSNNAVFLPASAPSQRAAALAAPFHTGNAGATAVIVASRSDGPLTAADDAAVQGVEGVVGGLPGVRSVTDQGTSADSQVRRALVVTSFNGGRGGDPDLVGRIRAAFAAAAAPPGLDLHLTGPLAQATDAAASASRIGTNIHVSLVLFVIVLLFVVYRSVVAPLATLLPAVLSLLVAGPVIALASRRWLPISPATDRLLHVLLLGAGTAYGLFLVYRVREELRRGSAPADALVAAMDRVGLSITYSALTAIAALGCLVLASFALYQGLGPSLAIGVAVMLLASLTLLPALLSIFGRVLFWPARPTAGERTTGAWGRMAARVVRHPVLVLGAGVLLFGALSAGMAGFAAGGFTSGTPGGTDSAAGDAAIAGHFPAANSNPETLVLPFATPVWENPESLSTAQGELASAPELRAVSGPLDPNGTPLTAADLVRLHGQLGPAGAPAPGMPASTYRAYLATAQFISVDGRTVLFDAHAAAGPTGSQAAIGAIPALRAALEWVARDAGAVDSGGDRRGRGGVRHRQFFDVGPAGDRAVGPRRAGRAADAAPAEPGRAGLPHRYGRSVVRRGAGHGLVRLHPLGGDGGLNFVIPILLFIFAMALGEDYNILLMTRVREEARGRRLPDALTAAVGHTGGTITSAGLILAGTFAVLAVAGGSDQSRQLGFTIAFAVLLDTFFVRTLLVPSIAVLLGRWNWWPSALSRAD